MQKGKKGFYLSRIRKKAKNFILKSITVFMALLCVVSVIYVISVSWQPLLLLAVGTSWVGTFMRENRWYFEGRDSDVC